MSDLNPPFQISENDVARSSLEQTDIGFWALLVTGCYHRFESEEIARETYDYLMREGRKCP